LLGTACVLGSATAANAAITTPTGWYVSLGAGINWVPDGSVDYKSFGVVTSPFEYSWEDGYIVAGAVGYDFGKHWRVEFEVAYRDNDGENFCRPTGTCGTTTVELWELSQMVNVLYDFPLGGNWEVAVGAGVGGNFIEWDWASYPASDDYVFAAQLIAQAAYRFTERWQLYLDYHFMWNDDPEFDDPLNPGFTWEMEKTDHSILLGIRFDLQGTAAPPPSPAPAPAPAPRSPKQFIVFFGFNKSNLTPEADRVVGDAAAAAKEYGSASIIVVGHTDTVGSNSYNNALSMRRSHAVKDGLVGRGIPADAISTGGRGESELMVQTGDGVKEPQNRRATIDLN
jgi:outer membrane protein OmpA-like peptidoglycan-associated protein